MFNSNEDRELYIKLNAERMIEFDKNCFAPNGMPYSNALHPRSMDEAMINSRDQVEYDEKKGKLRYSLEELILLDYDALEAIRLKQHREFFKGWDLI